MGNKRHHIKALALLLLAYLFMPVAVCAQLVITDCQGFTRAVQSVEPGQLSNVEINVTDALGNPADGIQVQLTNSATGEVTTAVAKNGVATFENLSSGTFSVSSSATGASIGSVSVSTVGVTAVTATTATRVGVTATNEAVAGVTAVTNEVVNQINS
ncbi:MAG: hypothetical protein D6719_07670, partial [Candidatus Dadabacteria bacterium]